MGRLDPQPIDIQVLGYAISLLTNYLIIYVIELSICNVNVTGDDNYLKNDEYRSHKHKDNIVCVYYHGQNL